MNETEYRLMEMLLGELGHEVIKVYPHWGLTRSKKNPRIPLALAYDRLHYALEIVYESYQRQHDVEKQA